ncbi:MAG: hypothetical protein JXB42_10340 [Deltaproteobacteria bacterium]|nr:hypothetical protein [Deltaproteobacteria bacterium]
MADKNENIKKKSREEFIREIIDRKVSLVQERDSRVTLVRTDDTKALIDMQPPIDKAIKRLRKEMGNSPKYPMELVAGVLGEFHDILVDVYRFAEKVTELSGLPFRPPRRFHPYKTGEEVPEEKTEINVIDVEKAAVSKSSKTAKAAG